MGDLLRSLTKPHTVGVRWLNGDNIGWKVTRGAQWRALNLVLGGAGRHSWYQSLYPARSVPTRTSGPKGGGL